MSFHTAPKKKPNDSGLPGLPVLDPRKPFAGIVDHEWDDDCKPDGSRTGFIGPAPSSFGRILRAIRKRTVAIKFFRQEPVYGCLRSYAFQSGHVGPGGRILRFSLYHVRSQRHSSESRFVRNRAVHQRRNTLQYRFVRHLPLGEVVRTIPMEKRAEDQAYGDLRLHIHCSAFLFVSGNAPDLRLQRHIDHQPAAFLCTFAVTVFHFRGKHHRKENRGV